MEPLDLSKAPPRSPYEQLGGLYMLARTVDKLRATLPGGNPGPYHIRGFSARLLEMLAIDEEDVRGVVAIAKSQDEVAEWVLRHSDPATYPQINQTLANRTLGQVADRAALNEKYPMAASMPPETKLFDLVLADDAEMFADAR